MTTLPDLAALRDALNSLAFVRPEIGRAYLIRRELRATVLREGLAVLALVDTLQRDNERQRTVPGAPVRLDYRHPDSLEAEVEKTRTSGSSQGTDPRQFIPPRHGKAHAARVADAIAKAERDLYLARCRDDTYSEELREAYRAHDDALREVRS